MNEIPRGGKRNVCGDESAGWKGRAELEVNTAAVQPKDLPRIAAQRKEDIKRERKQSSISHKKT